MQAIDGGDPAAAVVASPRGLAVLSALCREDLDVWPRRLTGPLGDPTAHPFDDRRPALDTTSAHPVPLDDPGRLVAEVLRAASGHAWWGEGRPDADAVARRGPAFLDAARTLLAAPGARWWGDDLARDRQVLLGPPGAAPDLAPRVGDQFRMNGPAFHGRIPQALRTSRRVDGHLPSADRSEVGRWAVRVDDDARVFEVHGPDDWRTVLTRYPRRVATTEDLRGWGVTTPETVVADWPAFAEDWEGLHVSVLGLLTAQGVPVRVDGLDAILEDVDVEMTAWFRVCWGEPEQDDRLLAR